MGKTKKPKASGYHFRGMFAGMDNPEKWVERLRKIAKKQHRSVSMQARVLLIEGIKDYENKIKEVNNGI